ncbi:hypothetical protein ADK34_09305 [Streptomyces viridochromogenes]|uniref:HTH luxR-type domain-containing protein n=1 Tax=Streptomyces viridochromogenes TaxID=1938 RepID=A0A0L8L2J9_STRVR|nr:hypothetical protein ADK34_09305 [Streptomyces viridochromogenes]
MGLLAQGAKDEVIARRLGMSLRTCRRHIAELLEELGAESRFQGGALAERAGSPGRTSRRTSPPADARSLPSQEGTVAAGGVQRRVRGGPDGTP